MIEAEKATYGVSRCAALLGVSRSGFYAWRARRECEPGPRAARRTELTAKIAVCHEESDGVYGSPRILADLRDAGERVSRKPLCPWQDARSGVKMGMRLAGDVGDFWLGDTVRKPDAGLRRGLFTVTTLCGRVPHSREYED